MKDVLIEIEETVDYPGLVRFFIDNGLEFSAEEEVPTDIVKCWRAFSPDNGELLGGCVLARRQGRFICDGIATDPKARGLGLGARLFDKLRDEAKAMGADAVYLVARAPGFFRKIGFVEVERENAPVFFECFSCPQYGASCHPEVMRLEM